MPLSAPCPDCGSQRYRFWLVINPYESVGVYRCLDCGWEQEAADPRDAEEAEFVRVMESAAA